MPVDSPNDYHEKAPCNSGGEEGRNVHIKLRGLTPYDATCDQEVEEICYRESMSKKLLSDINAPRVLGLLDALLPLEEASWGALMCHETLA